MQFDADEDGSPVFGGAAPAAGVNAAPTDETTAPAHSTSHIPTSSDDDARPESRTTDTTNADTLVGSSVTNEAEQGQTDSHTAAVATAEVEA